MVAPKQNLYVPIGGLQTDVDDKLLPFGKLLDLENGRIKRSGEVIKRNGTIQAPAPTNTPFMLAQHKSALVSIGLGGSTDLPIDILPTVASAAWLNSGITATATSRQGMFSVAQAKVATAGADIGHGNSHTTADVAYGGGYYWVAYLSPTDPKSLILSAMEIETGHIAFTAPFTGVTNNWSAWRVLFVNGFAVLCTMEDGGGVAFNTVNASTFATNSLSVGAVGIGGLYNLVWFDAEVKDSTTVFLAFKNNAANLAAYDFVPSTNTATAWTPHDTGGATPVPLSLGWVKDLSGSGKFALAVITGAAGLRVLWDIPSTGAVRTAVSTYVMDAGATAGGQMISGHTTGTSATGEFVVLYDTTTQIKWASRFSGSITTGATLYQSTAIRSKTWKYAGNYYFIGAKDSTTQGTHYVLAVPSAGAPAFPAPLAQMAVRQGGGGLMSAVASPGAGVFVVATSYTVHLGSGAGAVGINPDVTAIQLQVVVHATRPNMTIGSPKEAIDSLFVPGPGLVQYDGVTYAEAGFAYSPDLTSANLTPNAGGANTYYYAVLYSYMDAQGRLWRSGTSVPASVGTAAVIGGGGSVTVACPTLTLVGRQVQIEIYRGLLGDSVTLRKVASIQNNPAVTSINYVDTLTDANLATREILYTTGGVLGNDTPPGFQVIAVAQNRVWGVSQDDPQAIWYSTEFELGKGLRFNDALVVDARDQHGPIRGLAVVDDKLVVFKDDFVGLMTGAGPDVLGRGGTYAVAPMAIGVGSSQPQSIVETRDGVMFRSTATRAGIFLADRGGSLSYLGAGVQRYLGETIAGALFSSKSLEARFYTVSGRTLVFDLVSQQWMTDLTQPALAATSWNGVPTYADSSAGVVFEDMAGGPGQDAGAVIYTVKVGFPWIQINQLRGYERFYRVSVVGEAAGAFTLTMALYKDFDESAPLWGPKTEAIAGAGPLIGELRYSAKLTALKVVITDGGNATAGMKLSGIALVVAAKAGLKPTALTSRLT